MPRDFHHGLLGVQVLLSLSLIAGCAGPRALMTGPGAAEPDALSAAYQAAVEDARYPTASKISLALEPLVPGNAQLRWNGQGQLLMSTWTNAEFYPPDDYARGTVFPLHGDTWFTAVPFMQEFCTAYDGDSLALRLEQMLGLPPNAGKDSFLEVWVDPAKMFRPCPDPETSDRECLVRIPLIGHAPTPGDDEPPWYCPQPTPPGAQRPEQVAGAFVRVSQAHLNWMCSNWRRSYVTDAANPHWKPSPWTALGYTYDWGDASDHVGQSEFIAHAGSTVVFQAITPTRTYCN